jgi:hypothetical protein
MLFTVVASYSYNPSLETADPNVDHRVRPALLEPTRCRLWIPNPIEPVGRVVAEGVTRLLIDAERRICNPPYALSP